MRFRPAEEYSQQRGQENSQCRGPEMGMSLGFCRKKQEASMASVDEWGGRGVSQRSVGAGGRGMLGVYSKWEGDSLQEFSREV